MSSADRGTWRIDRLRCYAVAGELKSAKPPMVRHPLREFDVALAVWAEIVFVAVCHQTNWDRLHGHVMKIARSEPGKLDPSYLADLDRDLTWGLLGAGLESRVHLGERSRILNLLGVSARERAVRDYLHGVMATPVFLGGPGGFYEFLDSLGPYAEDPLRKKARILVQQLARSELITPKDPELLAPAVDYHIIRLYMRTGRVYPARATGYRTYAESKLARPATLLSLRKAVEGAMQLTAEFASLRIDDLNHLEWQVARSFCTREEARCNKGPLPAKLVDLPLVELSQERSGCPVGSACFGRIDAHCRSLVEPRSASSFY